MRHWLIKRPPYCSQSLTLYSLPSTFFVFINLFYLFIFGCVGSSLLRTGFLQLQRVGTTLCCGVRASHCGGFSCCMQSTGSRHMGFSSCGTRAQQLWRMGLVALWHVGSSWTRAQTHVPCIGRRILNHCTSREAPIYLLTPAPELPYPHFSDEETKTQGLRDLPKVRLLVCGGRPARVPALHHQAVPTTPWPAISGDL